MRGLFGTALGFSWEPMEYVQNAIHAMCENSVERMMCVSHHTHHPLFAMPRSTSTPFQAHTYSTAFFMHFNCDRLSQLNRHRTSGFCTSRQTTLAAKRRSGPRMQSAGGTAKHTRAISFWFGIFSSLFGGKQLFAHTNDAGVIEQHARALWQCLGASWEPTEYAQNDV